MNNLTLPKTLVAEIHSQANLKSSFQVAKVLIVPEQENFSSKVGLEVKLIPISQGKIDEEKFKPKSIFFTKDEIPKFDMLIFALAKARWIFFLQNNKIERKDIVDMVDFWLRKVRSNIEEGIK